MTSLAIILVLASSFLHVLRDFLTKRSEDKQIFIFWVTLVSLMYIFPIVAWLVWKDGLPGLTGVFIAMGVSAVHLFYWIFYTKAYDSGDLSYVYPIVRSSPALVLVFAVIFLGEKVSVMGVFGIILITLGIIFINLKIGRMKKVDPEKILSNKHVRFAFLALTTSVGYTLIDKVGVSYLNPLIYVFIQCSITVLMFAGYVFRVKARSKIFEMWRKSKPEIFLNGLIAAVQYPLVLFAFTLANVSYVNGFRQVGVVLAVILGGHFLKEENRLMRLAASMAIAAGAVLISVA